LSGAPLAKRATLVIAHLHHALQGALPIIGVGGIMDAAGATEKIEAGASLIQVYSGLVYRGPHLVREIAQVLCNADGGRLDVASST
jgi:dihydroorotate dehydrogenase